jgi:hypothetical protein
VENGGEEVRETRIGETDKSEGSNEGKKARVRK